MSEETVEREFMGKGKSRVWTYLILMVLLIVIAIVINVVWNNPEAARTGMRTLFGLPSYTLALITLLLGSLIFWVGLKMETDWPEALGAFLIAGSTAWGELIVGWSAFELGGIVVIPYILPLAIFALLLMYGMKRSV
jgi:hypothetical protein